MDNSPLLDKARRFVLEEADRLQSEAEIGIKESRVICTDEELLTLTDTSLMSMLSTELMNRGIIVMLKSLKRYRHEFTCDVEIISVENPFA